VSRDGFADIFDNISYFFQDALSAFPILFLYLSDNILWLFAIPFVDSPSTIHGGKLCDSPRAFQ